MAFLAWAALSAELIPGSAAAADGGAAVPPLTTTGQPVATEGRPGPGHPPGGGDPVAHGKFLAELMGCIDCHSPKGPDGKMLPGFLLAGHRPGDPWAAWSDSLWDAGMGMIVSPSGTAFSGPWGVTFGRNLTPDPVTGIGGWNEEAFIYQLREGTLKPPMPSLVYGNLSDDDLKAIFAYLQSVPAVKNLVPFRQLAPPRVPGEMPGRKGKTPDLKTGAR
jgi:hypothetical protein